MRMTSSSRCVIKEWNPKAVKEFIPSAAVSQPVVRELESLNLDLPVEKRQTEERDFSDQVSEIRSEETEDEEENDPGLEELRRQAEELLANARAEAETLKEEARQEGYAVGLDEGKQEGVLQAMKELQETLAHQESLFRQELSEALGKIEQAKNKCLQNYLDQLRDCSFAVAEKVIHTSLETSGDIIRRMIVFETEKLKKTAWLKIYMEKLDYDMMMETDADLVAELSKVSDNIKFIVMEKEQRGSCIIETPEEILDIGVETQMENIREIAGAIRV
ncbi:MAG: flagellar biosynthesis/type III secretory pathway protein [Lachnospiraceae bacterium]|nr:flagellar biosynthesis/type III secretory pathway protein [Lachnospiraceae bacterium]